MPSIYTSDAFVKEWHPFFIWLGFMIVVATIKLAHEFMV